MTLKECLLTNNNCYKEGKGITVQGLMLHSTGANNPNLRRYVQPDDGLLGYNPNGNDWNRPLPGGAEVCVHGFIGKLAEGSTAAYQTLPWNMRGWHAGGLANNTHIGVEICEDDLTDAVYFGKVYQEAVELFAYLCKEYNLNPLADGVVICHSEGYQRGIASNHADVMHWFPKHGKNMDMFRQDVANELKKQEEDDEMLTYEQFCEYMDRYLSINDTGDKHTQWASEAVAFTTAENIFQGDANGNYGWQKAITREGVAQVLYNMQETK